MITTALQGLPVPEPSDADNVPYNFTQLAQAIEGRLAMRFTTATARDAALASPVEGQVAILTTAPLQVTVRAGGAWVPLLPVWQNYTPTYAGISAIGNASVVARYTQIGKQVQAQVKVTMGSTTTYTTGALGISLPVAPAASLGLTDVLGTCYLYDASAGSGSRTGGVVSLQGGGNIMPYFVTSATSSVTATAAPWVLAVGDVISYQATYEAA